VLKLRRGVVVGEDPLTVEVNGEQRRAWADASLVGEVCDGDEVIVNTEALDLGLGSGGYDVVHVNLTRGLAAPGAAGSHVMKLNYTSLQHPVEPVERSEEEIASGAEVAAPVLVIPLHGHLAPAAWAAASVDPDLRVGFVQTPGGALPGTLSRDLAELRAAGLLCGHLTVAPAYGGEQEAISVAGALDGAVHRLGWQAVIAGPGPGMLGSESRYGHGGMAALDTAHAALALRLPTLLSPRLSAADPRQRHRGVSHHTRTVLELLLGSVEVAVPEGEPSVVSELEPLLDGRHTMRVELAELERYARSGLPARTMGRGPEEDPLFFEAPLAAGRRLAALAQGAGSA
jgi:hypothetical protein